MESLSRLRSMGSAQRRGVLALALLMLIFWPSAARSVDLPPNFQAVDVLGGTALDAPVTIAFASDGRLAESMLDKTDRFVEEHGGAVIVGVRRETW